MFLQQIFKQDKYFDETNKKPCNYSMQFMDQVFNYKKTLYAKIRID